MRVERFLEDSARSHGEKTALVVGSVRLSYRELDAMATAFAGAVQRRGLSRGDRVVIFADNCWEAVVGLFGVMKAGGVVVMVGASMKAEKLAFIIRDCRATALVVKDALLPVVREAAEHASSLKSVAVSGAGGDISGIPGGGRLSEWLAEGVGPMARPGIELDLAMLVYTSGSTGSPKGVMMTHQNVVAAISSITTYLENTCDDVILSVLPIAFNYGLGQIFTSVKVGATLVLEKSFAFPQTILEKMRAERATGFPLVPTIAALICQMRDLEPGMLPSLRYITNAAAALPTPHICRLHELFPTARVFSMYGLTECIRGAYMPPEELAERPASVGFAIPGTEAYVVDDDGLRLPPGHVGELVIRGPHVMKGYWENPEATAKALRPGPFPWEKVLYTGDLFRTDDEGYLFFVARKDDIIITRGEKVSPKEVENVLFTLPGVREAVVTSVPDPILGSAVKAIISADESAALTAASVIRYCARHLEDFMVPKHVEFRDELPKTESGKVSRREAARL